MTEQTFVKNLIKHKQAIDAMLVAMVGYSHTAEDLYQEAAVIMTQKREELPEDCNFLAWSRAVAVNVVRHYWRSAARKRVCMLDDQALEAVAGSLEEFDDPLMSSRAEALKKCTQDLTPEHRELLRLRYEQEVSIDEIAVKFSKNRGAIETTLYRIRKALVDCVERRIAVESH